MFNEKLQAQPYLVRNVLATAGLNGKNMGFSSRCSDCLSSEDSWIWSRRRANEGRLRGKRGKEGRQCETRLTTNSLCREPLGQLLYRVDNV